MNSNKKIEGALNWIENLPSNWKIKPLWAVSSNKNIQNNKGLELLSVYLHKGVIKFSDVSEKRTNVTSDDISKYQRVDIGDLVLNNQQAWRGSVGVSFFKGIVSPAYIVLELSEELDKDFSNYYFRDQIMISYYLVSSKGVGSIQRNLYFPNLKNAPVVIPPFFEQKKIASYLNKRLNNIDSLIDKNLKKIKLLKEYKNSLIDHCVTKGLGQNRNLTHKKIDWLDEIPKNWKIMRLKDVVRDCFGGSWGEEPSHDQKSNLVKVLRVSEFEMDTLSVKNEIPTTRSLILKKN